MRLHSYKDLIVWQKAMDLMVAVYELTNQYPDDERFGLIFKTRKTSRSIPYNIAEGRRRRTRKDYCHFLTISYGSGGELETQIEAAKRLPFGAYLDFRKVDGLLLEVMKMLNKMVTTLTNEESKHLRS